jgi:hypothetical protein
MENIGRHERWGIGLFVMISFESGIGWYVNSFDTFHIHVDSKCYSILNHSVGLG